MDTLLTLRRADFDVILVSSGAVGVGCRELGVLKRPIISDDATNEDRAKLLADVQAYAAVGQSVLMRTYSSLMGLANQKVAQVLLSSGDLGSEYQYYNAKNTLSSLLRMGVIPIVNENDTVATEELKYGDNDWLSALVSTVVDATWLFLLTDVDQLYSANPHVDPSAAPIDNVPNIEMLHVNASSGGTGTQWGTGGMKTKITAARLATAGGVKVCLLHGRHPARILDFVYEREKALGTVFEPLETPLKMERKKWIANCLPPQGDIIICEDAVCQLRGGSALHAVGVIGCNREFEPNSAVCIRNEKGAEIARGVSNYSSEEVKKLKGMTEIEIIHILGYPMTEHVVHEENLAVLVEQEKE